MKYSRLLFVALTMSMANHVCAQKLTTLAPNRSFALYVAASYPYQSFGVNIPIPHTTWSFQSHFNTDGGDIYTNLQFNDNQFIGALNTIPVNKRIQLKVGAGMVNNLHKGLSTFSFSPILQAKTSITPLFDAGLVYTQPMRAIEEWNSTMPVIQVFGNLNINYHRRNQGTRPVNVKVYDLWMHASTGIYYTSFGLEYANHETDHWAVRGQLFTDLVKIFPEEKAWDMQWIGPTYRSQITDELSVKGGAGLGIRFQNAELVNGPVFYLGVEQKLIERTNISIEFWQPTHNDDPDQPGRKPFLLIGINLQMHKG